MTSIGVVAEDNRRTRYLISELKRRSLRVHLIDTDKRNTFGKINLDFILIVRDYVNHSVIEKATASSKNAKVIYLDRSSKSHIDKFCKDFKENKYICLR